MVPGLSSRAESAAQSVSAITENDRFASAALMLLNDLLSKTQTRSNSYGFVLQKISDSRDGEGIQPCTRFLGLDSEEPRLVFVVSMGQQFRKPVLRQRIVP